ncbi:unnamed protein product [Rangifer tarandus platyrhynchus]|uniref:Uncharacterized protein n=2 Tax=Rangifer tarandus platyrhynchus TaxID=3082113 RepID=A0ABN8YJ84_RANTA|nr:unnamed protein product [Rangifer tarandus platyrhynchus]CAI9699041.1 unnamed protein product [Rangifer tarandus platyrhynchus]
MHNSLPLPGNPSYLHPREPPGPPISSPIPSPTIKTTSWPHDGGQARAGGAGLGPRLRPRASPPPDAPFALPRLSPPTSPRQLPGSFVALARLALWNARASPSQARPSPTPRLREGLAEGGKRRGGMRERRSWSFNVPGAWRGPGQGAPVTSPLPRGTRWVEIGNRGQ